MARGGQPAERPAAATGREHALARLIALVAEGDRAALAALYDATSTLVHGLAFRIVRERPAAEEVTLEVYMQVYGHAASFDAARGSPSAWLLTLTRSRAIDRRRADALRQRCEDGAEAMPLLASDDDPEESSSAAERGRLTRAALAALAPEQRQVIEIAYFSGLSHSEIAARLGQPLGTVKTRIRTGMARLRDLLGPLLAEGQA